MRIRRVAEPDERKLVEQIAEQVVEHRRLRDLSQQELAELCGTTQPGIARFERGVSPPRVDTLLRIANALDCELVVEFRARTRTERRPSMTVRTDVEQIQSTRTEKLLAVVLAAFLVLGGVWTYTRLDNVVRSHAPLPRGTYSQRPAEQKAVLAETRFSRAENRRQAALRQLVLSREAYRAALEAHGPSARKLGTAYDAAQARYAASRRAVDAARQAVSAAAPAAQKEGREIAGRVASNFHRQARDAFLARLGFVAIGIVGAYVLLAALRRQATRWFPLAGSVVAAATILAFVLASDYTTDYFNPFDWGLAFIALLGIVSTLFAYWALQRYHRAPPAAAPGAPHAVPVLRLSRRRRSALRGMRPRCRRALRPLRGAAARRHRALRRVRGDLTPPAGTCHD